LPNANLKESSFDIVTAWAVFEHLHNPSDYFFEVQKVLKPGGKFIFLVTIKY
jgi:2-polyprenyl-3-methyl-5-hydroxy-6-metoxy-1,4-benzoquinol methylase